MVFACLNPQTSVGIPMGIPTDFPGRPSPVNSEHPRRSVIRAPLTNSKAPGTALLSVGHRWGMEEESTIAWLVVSTLPLWKYDFVSWDYFSQYMKKNMFQTTNQ